MRKFALLLSGALMGVLPANGIIIRHDRDDSKYLEFGARFAAVCSIGRAGEGTLIAPLWILSAAHVTQGSSSLTVECEGVQYKIAMKFIFPGWRDMWPNDIGLIKLAEPVRTIKPNLVYERTRAEKSPYL